MSNLIQFIFVVFVWGSTWIAIKFQIEVIPFENSIFYRFSIAALVLILYVNLSKKVIRITLEDHLFCALQGLMLFCLNFYFLYKSTVYIESGLVSVIFAMSTIFNALNNRIWNKISPSINTVIGSLVGVLGLVFIFIPSLTGDQASYERVYGLTLAIIGTYCFSCGNIITVRNKAKNISLLTTNTWGMIYGAIIMLGINLATIKSFDFDWSEEYIYSLLFLAIPGSVLVFAAYLNLIRVYGANRAAYATVLFPIVALTISHYVEGFNVSYEVFIGIAFVVAGNIVVFWPAGRKGKITSRVGE